MFFEPKLKNLDLVHCLDPWVEKIPWRRVWQPTPVFLLGESHGLQHDSLPCPSSTPRPCSNSCPSSRWCYPTISSSVVAFYCLQSFPASRSFPVSQFFTSGGQSIGDSASVLPMNIQDWCPLGLTGWNYLQSKGLSRVFSNTTVQKHQFFSAQLPSQSNSHIHTWLLEKK